MTGRRSRADFAGVHTFKYKQSSLAPAGDPVNRSIAGSCTQLGPNAVALLVPDQATTGCGFFQRNSPRGDAANGMPLNDAMPFAATPSTSPPVTRAVSTCAPAAKWTTQAIARQAPRIQ